ncbi:MAG: MBL fold metallo-hydrolase [Candidatus Diapherotrites archaeon]|nr:MBL fold metallo-hydrolase [Candidatus Diapherotrites archaeon]MDZ4256488.1 MBL fold metallo-hydrolase [archaeon]
MHIRYLGHSCFLLEFSQANVLIDPGFGCENFHSYKRILPSLVKPENLPRISLILITNELEDHFDKAAIEFLCNRDGACVVAHDSVLSELDIPPRCKRAAAVASKLHLRGIQINVQTAHYPRSFYPMAYMVTGDGVAIYHAGDTELLEEFPDELNPHVALLPIGGGNLTMDIVDAVKATKMLKPEVVIPMHYNTFSLIQASPEEFAKKIEKSNLRTKPVILNPNEAIEFLPESTVPPLSGKPENYSFSR